MNNEYSVYQFFEDGSYERIKHFVSVKEATDTFAFFTHNVCSRVGLTKRVIITDGGDATVAEWVYGKGLVWPRKEEEDT